jgi:hypothetical protein
MNDIIEKNLDSYPKNQYLSAQPIYFTVGANLLRKSMAPMYQGSLIITGNPSIQPNDIVFLNDFKTNMHGPFYVRKVVHSFSRENGFTTTVTPGLITHNRSMWNAANLDEVNFAISTARYKTISGLLGSILKSSLFSLGASVGLGAYKAARAATAATKAAGAAAAAGEAAAGAATTGAATAATGEAAAGTVASVASKVKMFSWGRYGLMFLGFGLLMIPEFLRIYHDTRWIEMNNLVGRRSMFMVPLWYNGLPYVAGIGGYRQTDYITHMVDSKFSAYPTHSPVSMMGGA